jgi:hypothetical protein
MTKNAGRIARTTAAGSLQSLSNHRLRLSHVRQILLQTRFEDTVWHLFQLEGAGKVISVHAMKSYKSSGGIPPLILKATLDRGV